MFSPFSLVPQFVSNPFKFSNDIFNQSRQLQLQKFSSFLFEIFLFSLHLFNSAKLNTFMIYF